MSKKNKKTDMKFLHEAVILRISNFRKHCTKLKKKPDIKTTHALSTSIRRLMVVNKVVDALYGRKMIRKKASGELSGLRNVLGGLRDVQELLLKAGSIDDGSAFSKYFIALLSYKEKNFKGKIKKVLKDYDVAYLENNLSEKVLKKIFQRDLLVLPECYIDDLLEGVLELKYEAVDLCKDNALHRMRIRYKSFRYGVEILYPALGYADKKYAGELRELQTVLGEAHDWMVMMEIAKEVAFSYPYADSTPYLKDILKVKLNQSKKIARDFAVSELEKICLRVRGRR